MSYHISILRSLDTKGSWVSRPCLTLCCIWNSPFSPLFSSTHLIFWHLMGSTLLLWHFDSRKHRSYWQQTDENPTIWQLHFVDLPKIFPDCLKLECCNQIMLWHKKNLNCRCRLWFTTYNISFLIRWGLSAPDSVSENADVSYDEICIY